MVEVSSLPRIIVAVGAAQPEGLERLVGDCLDRGERFLEIRLDLLERPEQGLPILAGVQRRTSDAVVLATCRRQAGGGSFDGSIADEAELLNKAVEAGAQLVDVEIESAAERPEIIEALRRSARVVVSFHDFRATPPLPRVLERLQAIPADVHKIATTALQPTDNARLLSLLEDSSTPLIVMAMGETGLASRVLAPIRGGLFTFGAPDGAAGTAPGQLAASALRNVYRVDSLSRETRIFGVIADPVGHSLSPVLHNRAFAERQLDAVYLPFRVERPRLPDFFRLVDQLPVEGFSVTIPHKQAVIEHLGGVDPLAQRLGAVNTVYRWGDKLWGANTDAQGVAQPLERRLSLGGRRALVVGAGGAARAAAFALADRGAEVVISARRDEKARRLAAACGGEAIPWAERDQHLFDALVHCTPVGMHPHVDETVFPDRIPAEIVFDTVYNPLETRLLRDARACGKQVIPGLEMFLEQAAEQFRIWTGDEAPCEAMRDAVLGVLAGARSR